MTPIKRWPAVLTRKQFHIARLVFGVAFAIAMLVWIDLLMRWQQIGWLHKAVAIAYLVLLSPSLPEVFESYETYRADQSKRFGESTTRHK